MKSAIFKTNSLFYRFQNVRVFAVCTVHCARHNIMPITITTYKILIYLMGVIHYVNFK